MYGLQLGHFGMDLEILLTGHPNYLLLLDDIFAN